MVKQCVTVNVMAPAHIISTNMEISSMSYVEPCTIQVAVDWQNIGDITGTFTPSIKVDGNPVQHSSESLNGGQTVPHSFTVSNLMAGSHTIEADPNTGTSPQTIIVHTPSHIISTTLTVDKNNCTTPCTVGGTVSWTNNGETTNLPIDLSITVNGTQHIVASNVIIDPGQTTELYPFSLTNLTALIYEICASPDSGTACQTIVVRTPICSWITSKGGKSNIAAFDIITLVSAYLGNTNIGFTVTIAHIMGSVAYYLNNTQSGDSLTGCPP